MHSSLDLSPNGKLDKPLALKNCPEYQILSATTKHQHITINANVTDLCIKNICYLESECKTCISNLTMHLRNTFIQNLCIYRYGEIYQKGLYSLGLLKKVHDMASLYEALLAHPWSLSALYLDHIPQNFLIKFGAKSRLKSLHLNIWNDRYSEFKSDLFGFISVASTLKCLSLTNMSFDSDIIKGLTESLEQNSTLEVFSIIDCDIVRGSVIGNDYQDFIFCLLAKPLKTLVFDMTSDMVPNYEFATRQIPDEIIPINKSLTALNFSLIMTDIEVSKLFINTIKHGNLRYFNLGFQNYQAWCDALVENQSIVHLETWFSYGILDKFFEKIANNKKLRNLSIDYYSLKPAEANILAYSLSKNSTLESLSCRQCLVHNEQDKMAFNNLFQSFIVSNLRHITIDNLFAKSSADFFAILMSDQRITSITLTHVNFTNEAIKTLALGLRYNASLEILLLTSTILRNSELVTIMDNLEFNQCLKHLKLSTACTSTTDDDPNNDLDIFRALSYNQNLIKLELSNFSFSVKIYEKFALVLKYNQSLQHLSLPILCEGGLKHIAEALQYNSNIKNLTADYRGRLELLSEVILDTFAYNQYLTNLNFGWMIYEDKIEIYLNENRQREKRVCSQLKILSAKQYANTHDNLPSSDIMPEEAFSLLSESFDRRDIYESLMKG